MDKLLIRENNIADEYAIHWDKSIGCGINGDVYLCTDNLSRVQHAVKILPYCTEALDEVFLQWKCKESENIVQIMDVYINGFGEDEDDEYLFIVMELMNGGELFDYLQGKQICEEEAKEFIYQILTALDFIHQGNIVHRDLKPENILINKTKGELVLKLADFGYAEMDDQGLTNPLYTLYYVAPEVLQNDTRFKEKSLEASSPVAYDKKCDIWSLGVIAYIMLMGYPPFSPEGPNIEMTPSMYESILSGEFYYGEMDWQKYSDDAHDFVFSLLQVNPEDRPTALQLLKHPWFLSNTSPSE